MSKTVFILGAGFSAPAGIPVQDKIMTAVPQSVRDRKYFNHVTKYYSDIFRIEKITDYGKIPLEDIFTFFDRAIANGEDTNAFSYRDTIQIQRAFRKTIAMVIYNSMRLFVEDESKGDIRNAYSDFFSEVVAKRIENNANDYDPLAILSTNWDTLPEYFIQLIEKKLKRKIMFDYCCYDYDYFERKEKHTPSIHLKAKGFYNIKIHKLHGSLNWSYCSNCGRLWLKLRSKFPPVFFEKQANNCHNCENVRLRRLLIMPTMLKDINNTHLKMVWHNALMDLQEAERIFFIGYSFPLADFEFRYMLAKAIAGGKRKKVRAILYPPDKAQGHFLRLGDYKKALMIRDDTAERYCNFFGGHDFQCKYMDVIDVMKKPDIIWDW